MSRFTRMLTGFQKAMLCRTSSEKHFRTRAIAATTLRSWGERLEFKSSSLPEKTLIGTPEEEEIIQLGFKIDELANSLKRVLERYAKSPDLDRDFLIFARECADRPISACERVAAELEKHWPHGATYLSERGSYPVIEDDT